jgi:ribosomal-protein-alanine N-acetyltransferase
MMRLFSRLLGRNEPAILDARPADAGALASVHGASFAHGWSESEFDRLLTDRAVVAQLARAEGGRGAVLGFILSRRAADEAEILTVAVVPRARGRGIATDLVRRHLGRLAALGVARLFLEVEEQNEPALRLYRRYGFREVGRRPRYYRDSGDPPASALILRRDLA